MKPKPITTADLIHYYHMDAGKDAAAAKLARVAAATFAGHDHPGTVAGTVAGAAAVLGIPAFAPELASWKMGFPYIREAWEEGQAKDRVKETTAKAKALLEDIEKAATEGAGAATLRDGLKKLQDIVSPALATDKKGLQADELDAFGDSEGIPIRFFNGLHLPSPGITLIGAETGGGKSTALVNICRELLQAGKKVLYFSYEMSAVEIGLALRLSLTADRMGGQTPVHPPGLWSGDALDGSLFGRLRVWIGRNGIPEFLQPATDEVRGWIQTDRLRIIDNPGHAGTMYAEVIGTDFDAYILDYMQAVPAAPDAAKETYRRVAETVERIREAGNVHGKTIVTAGQFNREGKDKKKPDIFDPHAEQFREAADLEQMATLAIGLGYFPDGAAGRRYFWKILKHRFAGNLRGYRMFSTGEFDYHYNQSGGAWTKPKDWLGTEEINAEQPPELGPEAKKTRSRDEDEVQNGKAGADINAFKGFGKGKSK